MQGDPRRIGDRRQIIQSDGHVEVGGTIARLTGRLHPRQLIGEGCAPQKPQRA